MTNELPRVGHRLAYKHSVGRFENVDMEYWIEMPVQPGETVEEVVAGIEAKVDDLLANKLKEIDDDFKGKR